jgi:4-hydroxybenzoate polyprenyltransferase
MKLLFAFFRLIRWPNVVFIALTQLLFYYCILTPLLPGDYISLRYALTPFLFALLLLASLLIAAAGYIINDYFDINIDQINKPKKMVIEKVIKRRTAILLHLFFSITGVIISIYVALHTNIMIAIANIICTISLWFYSTTFKRKLLSGNIIIAALTAWTIVVLYFAVNVSYLYSERNFYLINSALKRIYMFTALYAGFAFIISLIREVVKDMEDMEGDKSYGCKTLPIVWGVPVAKVFAGVWLVVLIGAIALIQVYALYSAWWWSGIYSLFFLIVPLIIILKKLFKAQSTAAFHQISSMIKWIMLLGILSMIVIKLYL